MQECKSCTAQVNNIDTFCSNCGGKIVDKRLSLKGTWQEFIGPFFSWDNNFWKTLGHLVIKPELVLKAYTSGARKKYFQPFSFLLVYASLALLIYKFFPIDISGFSEEIVADFKQSGLPMNVESSEQINDFNSDLYSNYNFLVVLTLPFMALLSYLSLKSRKHNFSEHLVFQAYIQTILGYSAIIMQAISTNLNLGYTLYSYMYFVSAFFYANYVFYRMYRYSWKTLLFMNIKFFGALILVTLCFIISGALFSFISLSITGG